MSPAFLLALVAAAAAAVLWTASFVAFQHDDATRRPSFLIYGFLGNLAAAVAGGSAIVGLVLAVLEALT